MRKLMKFALILMVVVLLAMAVITAITTDKNVEKMHILLGEEEHLWMSGDFCESSDTSVVEVKIINGRYHAEAVGLGKARVTGGAWMNEDKEKICEVTVCRTEFGKEIGDMMDLAGAGFYIAVLILLLFAAMIVYIFIEAPKCGMSRWWAVVPIFSNVLGIIIFIVVRQMHKAGGKKTKITCPTCGGVCTDDTAFCPICGTKLR